MKTTKSVHPKFNPFRHSCTVSLYESLWTLPCRDNTCLQIRICRESLSLVRIAISVSALFIVFFPWRIFMIFLFTFQTNGWKLPFPSFSTVECAIICELFFFVNILSKHHRRITGLGLVVHKYLRCLHFYALCK